MGNCLILFFLLFLPISFVFGQKDQKAQTHQYTLTSQAFAKFKEYINILNKEKPSSKNYKEAITFLESSLYNNSSFETLSTLANLYNKKKDYQNELKILKVLAADYPNIHLSHYKLGMAYKKLYLHKKKTQHLPYEKIRELKTKAIDSLSKSITQNRAFEQAYIELLPFLKNQNIHTHNSLSLVMDMIRYLKKPSHYTELCEAYYETKYIKQSRKACKIAIKKDPQNPKSRFLYALLKESPKEVKQQIITLSKKYPNSFYVQYKTGEFFKEQNATLSMLYFHQALKINPESVDLNKMFALQSFEDSKYKEAHKYFLKACILTQGMFLPEFQKAKSRLNHKDKSLVPLFQKGVDECVSEIKKAK